MTNVVDWDRMTDIVARLATCVLRARILTEFGVTGIEGLRRPPEQ